MTIFGEIVVLRVLGREEAALAARSMSNRIVRDVGVFRAAILDQETGLHGFLHAAAMPRCAWSPE